MLVGCGVRCSWHHQGSQSGRRQAGHQEGEEHGHRRVASLGQIWLRPIELDVIIAVLEAFNGCRRGHFHRKRPKYLVSVAATEATSKIRGEVGIWFPRSGQGGMLIMCLDTRAGRGL